MVFHAQASVLVPREYTLGDGQGLQKWVAVDGKERRPYFVHETTTPGMLHFVVRSGDPPPDLERHPHLDDLASEVGAVLGGFQVLPGVVVANYI